MNDILNKTIVLVLNRNWQAINVRTPQEAFCMMATNVGTALEIEGENQIRPVTWDEWITLPMRPQDNAVQTVRGPIRVPTVIVAVNFAKVPKKRPKLCARTIRERDGNRCQYTGVLLRPDQGSLDHVVPRSRGGRDTWENLVWSGKDVNAHKGNRLPHEAGLKLLNSSSAAVTSRGCTRRSLINRPIRNQPRGEKVVHRHAEDHGEKCDSLVGDGGTTSFHVGYDFAGHVTPKQLHSRREHVLRPALLKAKPSDIPSNDVYLSAFSHL